MRCLRPVDLARAAGMSTQQVRRYEAAGVIPPAPRSETGYRLYTEEHLAALLTTRAMIAGFGWQSTALALHHLHAGRPERAFAIADRAHLNLHEARRRTLATLEALRAGVDRADGAGPASARTRHPLRIGEAAALVGVRVSALRHWEEEGLLRPDRDRRSGYRSYGTEQLRRIQVIAMLRASNYGVTAIRDVVRELSSGDTDGALRAADRRLADINAASLECAGATAAMWQYHQHRASSSPAASDGADAAR